MLKKLVTVVLVALIAAPAAACDVPTKINKGQASPCEGYVMSPRTEERIRTDLKYKDELIKNLQTASDLQADLIAINARQIDLYRSELEKSARLSTMEKVMYFGFGVLVTGAVAYGTAQALR